MSAFKVVLIDHGYASVKSERDIIAAAGGECIDADGEPLDRALGLCEDADGICVRWLKTTPDIIRRFRRCKMIMRYGVGTDNVDVNAATEAGIMVGHVPNYCIEEVSTHAIAQLLACVRNVLRTHRKLEGGGWDENPPEPVHRMAGRTLGLVGFGHIAQAVARKLGGWGMTLLATDPFVEPQRAEALGVRLVDLDTLCREADYVSLHVPLLPETRHLIGSRELGLMKRGAILVNTARGPVVDANAVIAALDQGGLAAAALDVFEGEPLPKDSPLRRHLRVVLSDHMAWYSEESLAQLKITAAEEVVRVCTGGLPQSLANPEVLRRLGRFAEWIPSDTARWQLKRLDRLKSQPGLTRS